jgi:hypothetical protein
VLSETAQGEEELARSMALPQPTTAEHLAHERDLLNRLRAWYIAPGRQHDLLKSENEAFQAVIRLLEQRTKMPNQ